MQTVCEFGTRNLLCWSRRTATPTGSFVVEYTSTSRSSCIPTLTFTLAFAFDRALVSACCQNTTAGRHRNANTSAQTAHVHAEVCRLCVCACACGCAFALFRSPLDTHISSLPLVKTTIDDAIGSSRVPAQSVYVFFSLFCFSVLCSCFCVCRFSSLVSMYKSSIPSTFDEHFPQYDTQNHAHSTHALTLLIPDTLLLPQRQLHANAQAACRVGLMRQGQRVWLRAQRTTQTTICHRASELVCPFVLFRCPLCVFPPF